MFKSHFALQRPDVPVAIKAIAKKNIGKSKNLLTKEIKILKVRFDSQFAFSFALFLLLGSKKF